MHDEKFYQLHTETMIAVATSKKNLKKTDPSEIERTYNIRKQQTNNVFVTFPCGVVSQIQENYQFREINAFEVRSLYTFSSLIFFFYNFCKKSLFDLSNFQ